MNSQTWAKHEKGIGAKRSLLGVRPLMELRKARGPVQKSRLATRLRPWRDAFASRGRTLTSDRAASENRQFVGQPPAPDHPLDFEELYLRLRDPVLRWATSCLHNRQDAEDVVSEAFEALRRALPRIRSNSAKAIDSYFYTIVRNLICRPRRKGEPLPDDLAVIAEEPEEEPVWLTTTPAELKKAIGRLEAVDQQVIVLALFDRLPHREIASRLALATPNAVAIRLFRAKQALRSLVEEELACRVPPMEAP